VVVNVPRALGQAGRRAVAVDVMLAVPLARAAARGAHGHRHPD
jgi:hypothetical protein